MEPKTKDLGPVIDDLASRTKDLGPKIKTHIPCLEFAALTRQLSLAAPARRKDMFHARVRRGLQPSMP